MNLSTRIQTAGLTLLIVGCGSFMVCLACNTGSELLGSMTAVALVGAALVCATLEGGQS